MSLLQLNNRIIQCTRCPRLVAHREKIAKEKVRRYAHQDYWGKPVPGFGDDNPSIMIVGLAPAAHGANRTGRMFTGDSSGDWLYRVLYETGFANMPQSQTINDGLILKDVYITASVRCAPPDNKPLPEEIENCRDFLENEFRIFKNVKILVALGQIALINICKLLQIKRFQFGHNLLYQLNTGQLLLCSYHPSRQNTQTKLLLWEDWMKVFERVKNLIEN